MRACVTFKSRFFFLFFSFFSLFIFIFTFNHFTFFSVFSILTTGQSPRYYGAFRSVTFCLTFPFQYHTFMKDNQQAHLGNSR